MKHWCINLFLVFVFATNFCAAQFPTLQFSTIDATQGLSNRLATTVYQDKQGFIWVGTTDGLNRLDGYRIKNYFYRPNTSSLPNNAIWQLTGKQNMYASTESGVAVYRQQGLYEIPRFTHMFRPFVYEDDLQTWICYKDSLYRYQDKLTIAHKIVLPKHLNGFKQPNLQGFDGLIKDDRGVFWAWKEQYLFELNSQMQPIRSIIIATHPHDGIQFVHQDPQNKQQLWVGTWGNGLFSVNTNIYLVKTFALQNFVVHDLDFYQDIQGRKWLAIATDKGLVLVDPITTNYQLYALGECWDICIDHQQTLWCATGNGLVYVEKQKQWFNTIQLSTTIASLANTKQLYLPSTVSYIDGRFFVGIMYGKGVAIYNHQWQLEQYLPSLLPATQKQYYQEIKEVLPYKQALWFATDSGLVKTDKHLQVIKVVLPTKQQNASKQSYFKMRKLIAINDSIWLIKSPFAIHVFNASKEQFIHTYTHIANLSKALPEVYLSDCCVLKEYCFITTDEGLLQLNWQTGEWQWILESFANKRMICVAAKNETVWVGTQTGLSAYHLMSKKVTNYYRNDGLSSDAILNISIDHQQRVWLNTSNGLSCFNPTDKSFTRIYKTNGLPENNMEGFLWTDTAGKVYTGTINAITWFYADKVLQKKEDIPAILTEVLIHNTTTHWQWHQQHKTITTSYHQNNITVHFALLNYNNTALNKYYYQLIGADDTLWHESSTGLLQFSNLQHGKYLLRVSSTPAKNGVTYELYITILPPFYRTWWFALLMIVLAICITIFIYQQKSKTLREKLLLQQRYHQRIKEVEMQALRSQMNPHFIFNTLNAINSYILGKKTREASDFLVTFSKLVRHILDNSKQESITLEKELTALQLYIQLEQVRLDDGFTYAIEVQEEVDVNGIRVPPLIIQPFVENAIWHGIRNKATPGHVWIRIATMTKHEHTILHILIEDDGIGRANAATLKTHQTAHKSYGIQITQSRIGLLHPENQIDITDRMINDEANGTCVHIYLHLD